MHVAPTVGGSDGGIPGSRVRTFSAEDAAVGYMGAGYRVQPQQYQHPHARSGYMQQPMMQPGMQSGRHQQIPVQQGSFPAHGLGGPMFGQMGSTQPIPQQMYGGNAPALGYPPGQHQGYYNPVGYTDRFQINGLPPGSAPPGSMPIGPVGGGSINASQIVPPLPMSQPQIGTPYGYPQQLQVVCMF